MAPNPIRPDRRGEVLEELFRTHRRSLARQARRHSRLEADAEDALANACVKFLRHYAGPPGEDALRWMTSVVRHEAWRLHRRRRTEAERLGEANRFRRPDLSPSDRIDETLDVRRSFSILSKDERSALILLGLGFSYAEIESALGWTHTKVNRCLAEGRAKVRALIDGKFR